MPARHVVLIALVAATVSHRTVSGQNSAAQQPAAQVQLGILRVPACQPASDPEYGRVANKAIAIGGGPGYMAARERNYLNALRGPQGQMLRIANSVGSSPLPGDPERAIVDAIGVTYDAESGPVTTTLYLDAYHYDAPKAPTGFTCGAPLASVAPIPPADPFKMTSALVSLAIEHGTKADVTPISLDTSTPRGYFFDRYALIALQARAAATAGAPLDSAKPSRELEALGSGVLAYPLSCGDRTILPTDVELRTAQGPIARNPAGEPVRGEALTKAFPGLPTPPGSIGLYFRGAQPAQGRITYAEGCNGSPAEAMLSFRAEPPRLIEMVPGVRPPGIVEAEPVVYVQVILDQEGRIARPQYLGGPRSLYPAALDALTKWRTQPVRVNGAPVVTPNVLQVTFRP
jgi:hypothetical protein